MIRFAVTLMLLLAAPAVTRAQSAPEPPEWGPLARLIGSWEGRGTGRWGESSVRIEHEPVLEGYFLQGRIHSVYEPQEKNPEGEVHENWDLYSYDRDRGRWVMRQFHTEGFVNTYVLDEAASRDDRLVFVTEHIENIATLIGAGWRARQTLHFLNDDEYVEIFDLAGPGQEFQTYIETRFRRSSDGANRR